MSDARRVPGAPAPEFAAVGRVVAGDGVAADHDQFLSALMGERQRRAERLARFRDRIRRADTAPHVLAGGGVDREEVGFVAGRLAAAAHGDVALENLHDQAAVVQQRAGGKRPLERERSEVAVPEFLAGEIKRDEVARAVEEDDELAVGHGGRRTGVAVLAVGGGLARFRAPEFLPGLSIEAQRVLLVRLRIGGGEEDAIAPDDRRGGGGTGEGDGPFNALGRAELFGEAFLGGGTVVERAAPVGPVFGVEGGGGQKERGGEKESNHGA